MDGHNEALRSDLKKVVKACLANTATSIQRANSDAEQALLWKGRKAAFPAIGQLAPDYLCIDGTIPRKHLAKVLSAISQFSVEHGLAVANVFHAGDGNLHPLIMYDANRAGDLEKAEAIGAKIL